MYRPALFLANLLIVLCWIFFVPNVYSNPFFFKINPEMDSVKIVNLLDKAKGELASDYNKAIELLLEAKVLAYQSGNPYLISNVELNLGKQYFFLGLYEEALDCYINLIRSAELNEDFESLAKGYFQLSGVRLVMEDYDQAKTHLLKSREYYVRYFHSEEAIGLIDRLTFQNNMGLIYSGSNDLESARKEFELGLAMLSDDPSLSNVRIQLLNNMGDLNFKEGKVKEAMEYYNLAKEQLTATSNPLFHAMLDHSIGKTYLELESYADAVLFFQRGFSTAKKVKGYSHLRHLSKGLSLAYGKMSESDSAFLYLQLSDAYEDSLKIKKTAEKILVEELMSDYRQEKSQLLQLYEGNKKNLLWLAICSLTLIIFLFMRAYWIRDRLLNMERQRNEMEEIVGKSNDENLLLKRKIEDTQKEATLMSLNNLRKDDIFKQLSQTIHPDKVDNDSANAEALRKVLEKMTEDDSQLLVGEFEYVFENTHMGFFQKLKNQYPNLTPNERRLCAFLKLQLTTKEIAQITYKSIRSIELARIRLRKKLGLTNSEKNLNDFFLEF